jgi:hypothetical protein
MSKQGLIFWKNIKSNSYIGNNKNVGQNVLKELKHPVE